MKSKINIQLLGIVLLGFILRIVYLGSDSYWFDEANTIGFTHWPMSLFFKHYYIQRPVYFLILKAWTMFLGYGEFSSRLLSVFFSMLSLLFSYKLVVLFVNKKTALLASFLLALSFLDGIWSRVVMNYSFFAMVSIMSSYYFIRFLKNGHKKDICFCAIINIINIFTHPFSLFLVLAQNIVIIFNKVKLKRFWVLAQIFVAVAAMLLLYTLFFYPSFEHTYNTRIHEINYAPSVADMIRENPFIIFYPFWKLLEAFTFGGRHVGHGGGGFSAYRWSLYIGYGQMSIYVLMFILGIRKLYSKSKKSNILQGNYLFKKQVVLYISATLFFPILLTTFLEFWINPLLCVRFFFFSYIFFVTLVAIGLYGTLSSVWLRRSVVFLIALFSLLFWINLYTPKNYPTWRDISREVKIRLTDNDAIVLIPFGQITSFWFYFDSGNELSLADKTMDGIYAGDKWLNRFEYDGHIITGNFFNRIDEFIKEDVFKEFRNQGRDIFLVISPFWEERDKAAEKVYTALEKHYKRSFKKKFYYNGVMIEKWQIKAY